MSSPFSSFAEFSKAKGPIYTFANNPIMIGFLLVLCVAITIYFIYYSYTLRQKQPAKTPAALGLLLVAGAASLLNMVLTPHAHKQPERHLHQRSNTYNWQPLALLGMVGIGGGLRHKRRSQRHKPMRRLR